MANKRSKNQLRRDKAKQRKLDASATHTKELFDATETKEIPLSKDIPTSDEVEESNEIDNQLLKEFQEVFNRFTSRNTTDKVNELQIETTKDTKQIYYSDDDDDNDIEDSDDDLNDEEKTLSKRQQRIRNKVPLATLKASTSKPWNVEWFDVDAKDPFLLVALKSQPNTIPVPAHWSAKRDYLSSKRGIEKLPFELPKYIRDTGIGEMRQTDERTVRQQQREKVQPKMGRLDIDYAKLHDAFFKHQTRPRIFGYGDVYEEGKETVDELANEASKYKPGVISKELREALDMPESDLSVAPAWITIMKEIGKPPSYEELLIPGLDMEYSNTGYKDKGSTSRAKKNSDHWGKLLDTVESSEEEEEEEGDDEEESVSESESESIVSEDKQEEKETVIEKKVHQPVDVKSEGTPADNASKFLYKVLKEKSSKQNSSLLGKEFGYELNSNEESSKSDEETATTQSVADIFKF
ncbi:uncharacterized protein SPAPADRAFT_134460 [Spathaspora passalidarum NRRL Y-27907]|uniref:PSP proline-rich domain-containing protein n=1 Tax=Spathaspora passalidarum (strain NRRL Y-27907 / 11-Y1) TaxID=619300 RepID=G3AIL8_SPAPN|nr:uncharacterized protein SPAPADRAFT_134460 [Spathaspora passalidarum NRRL Y-27907]EGW33733.1 hypothetical protein SPAPADRAFT_134460 [Spathaspora passalidarum NRRL Y-27907]